MKNIFTAFLLLCFLYARGQEALGTISGTVSDATGKPLPYASVLVEGLKLGVLTDDNGQYYTGKLSPGKHKVVACYIGYGTRSNTFEIDKYGNNIKINFVLQENIENLDEVTVS